LNYEDLGRAVVERLLELARDDGLRTAQVEAFAADSRTFKARVEELEGELEQAQRRETELRVRLRTAEEALERAEENLRRALGSPQPRPAAGGESDAKPIEDDDARAVLEILRSGRA
jgi:chromosome segregation ATPase